MKKKVKKLVLAKETLALRGDAETYRVNGENGYTIGCSLEFQDYESQCIRACA